MSQTISPTRGETIVPLALTRRLLLTGAVVLAAVLRLWHLGEAGYGTEYYAASVRSMLADPHNLLFGAFDPAGVLAVDKPPLALWVQTLSAALLGFSPFALMLPQAIEGCLAVVLLWHLVRRDFGDTAALLAALFLALTPICVAVDRSNNTDSLLVLVLLLAVWALPRRNDDAAPWRLAVAMAVVGIGFNVKMLAAFGVLPGFAAAYALTARAAWPKRVPHLAAGGMALALVSVSWVGLVALTPASDRPYVDSTRDNSIFDLVVNHNAIQRFVPRAWGEAEAPETDAPVARIAARGVPAGAARLADPRLANQILWLLPLALAGAAGMIIARQRRAGCVWIGWAVSYALVFSYAGGIFSAYYLVMLGPPLAALAGVGVTTIARAWRGAGRHRWWLPAVLMLGCAWQAYILWPQAWEGPQGALLIAMLAGSLAATVALALPVRGATPAAALTIGVSALLIAPAAWSIGTIAFEGGRPLARLRPTPDRIGHAVARQSGEMRALLPYLRENRGDALFLAATVNARLAAPLIIATGEPVIAFGGFQGGIPVMDGAGLARLVDNGTLRFAILEEPSPRHRRAAETNATRWIQDHGTPVDLAAIAPELADARFELFDLRPAQPADSGRDP